MLSPSRDLIQYPLPLDLPEIQELLFSEEYKDENLLKKSKDSKPYSRKDAENLADWLQEMHGRHLNKLDSIMESNGLVQEELLEAVENIYMMALKEAVKQIATHCLPRAAMIQKTIEILKYSWKKSPSVYQINMERQKRQHLQDIEQVRAECSASYNQLLEKYQESMRENAEYKREKELMQYGINVMRKSLIIPSSPEGPKSGKKVLIKTLQRNAYEIATQTDNIESDSSEDSSAEEVGDISKVPILTPAQIFSRQQTLVQEKRPEHLNHLKKHLELAGCSENFNSEDLYQYITKEFCDFYAWVDGFRLSSEYFLVKHSNSEKNLKEIPPDEPESPHSSTRRADEKKRSYKDSSKITVFKFKSNLTMAQHINENSPIDYILQYLSTQHPKKISRISTMTFRKLSIQATNYVNIAKAKGIEQFPSFAIMVYSEIFQKYSLKPIANRKFKELVACCIKHQADYKIQIFLRMLGGGEGVGLSTFSSAICKLCIKIYEFMASDKTGILVETNNGIEPTFYPTARAMECVRQIHEPYLTRQEIARVIKRIEELSKIDPDDINKLGLIEIHTFVVVAVEALQEYAQTVAEGVKFAAAVITDFNYLTWPEICVLTRNVCPRKEIREADKAALEFNSSEECEIEKLVGLCTQRGAMRIEEVERFFRKTPPQIEFLVQKIREINDNLEGVLGKCEGNIVTLSAEEWEGRLEDIRFGIRGKSAEKAYMLWELMFSEYNNISK